MMKKSAFAFRGFDSEKILQRKFFRDIEVDGIFLNWRYDDSIITRLDELNNLPLQELKTRVKSLNSTIERVAEYEELIKKHLSRLNKLLEVDFLYDWGVRLADLIRNYSSFLADVGVLEMRLKSAVKLGEMEIQKRCIEAFPNRLKTARREAGLTQKQLADLIGVGKAAVSHYEQGVIEPPLNRVILLSRKLNKSIDWLVGLNS